MKIAVLTHCNTKDNYGEVLQGFALQHYLRNRGHDAYIVRYKPTYQSYVKENSWVSLFSKLKYLLDIFGYLKARKNAALENKLITYNLYNNPQRKFDEFRAKYLKMSEEQYTSIEQLRADPPKADVYICGSDQVWHDSLSQINVAGWYLQFGDKRIKRISYAPSIGREIEIDEVELFKKYLSCLDALSLREKKVHKFCEDLGFKEAKIVCDPTLLLTADYYRNLFCVDADNVLVKPYVFFYTLNIQEKNEIFWASIKTVIDENKWDVKSVGSSGYYQAKNIIPGSINILATVEEWIQLISNSKLVVSTSFHAVVFSIILHKPFVSIPLKGRYAKANDRVENLLDDLGLTSRICKNPDDMKVIIKESIDWQVVDEKIESLRQNAINYLINAGL